MGVLEFSKSLEQLVEVVLFDSNASVFNFKAEFLLPPRLLPRSSGCHLLVLHPELYLNIALLSELESVANQVHQDLLDALFILKYDQLYTLVHFAEQLDSLDGALVLEYYLYLLDQLVQVEVVLVQCEVLVVIKFGEVLDILNHAEDELEGDLHLLH